MITTQDATAVESTFQSDFTALTGHPPFPWQERLYARMLGKSAQWPDAIDVPTGLGKTSAVVCWLLALAAKPKAVPRRLVYVVNRRTIVDQVTDVATGLWTQLRDDGRLTTLRRRLACEVAGRGGDSVGDALAISTLRGEFADNGAWRADPARASIVVGTPDLIGSDLLFSGYRTGKRSLAHHAGLFGHDALLVHDESHLSPAMQTLLDQIAEMQREASSPRPIRVLALSATRRESGGPPPLTIDDDDRAHSVVRERLEAFKRLDVVSMEPETNEKAPAFRKRWLGAVADRAWEPYHDKAVRIIVYVRSPDDAKEICDDLLKRLRNANKETAESRIAFLTGRLRGKERDKLAAGPVLNSLREPKYVAETVYLVATSAGEVGADLDADHLVCDLTTADALIQRLGRVNRRGTRTADDGCDVHLIVGFDPEPKQDAAAAHARWRARQATHEHLKSLPGYPDAIDASPLATRERWNIPDDCREPVPETLPLTEPMMSALSMTSVDRTRRVKVKTRGREGTRRVPTWPLLPDVATLIHGLVEETAEVTLAWRAEVLHLAHPDRSAKDIENLTKRVLRACPVRVAERLTVPVNAAAKWIADRAKEHEGEPHVGLLVGRGVERLTLEATSDDEAKKRLIGELVGRTLLVPPAFGGLDKSGMLDAKAEAEATRLDVGDNDEVERHLLRASGDGFETRRLSAVDDGEWQTINLTVRRNAIDSVHPSDAAMRRRVVIPLRGADDGTSLDLIVFRKPDAKGGDKRERVPLDDHNQQVHERAARFARALRLPEPWQQALRDAALRHDTGKSRELWQTYAGNLKFDDPVAKPVGRGQPDWHVLDGYRHEYGSLIDAINDGVTDPLMLHLIASHHPAARPHFDKLFDPHLVGDPPAAASAVEIALRFEALQKEHGPWGLAWLEALLRSADRTVSAGDAADDFDAEEDADA